jgi:hypothetical protein
MALPYPRRVPRGLGLESWGLYHSALRLPNSVFPQRIHSASGRRGVNERSVRIHLRGVERSQA